MGQAKTKDPISGQTHKMTNEQGAEWLKGIKAASAGDWREAVRGIDNSGGQGLAFRAYAMEQLSKQTVDPFDTLIREAAMAQIRRRDKGTRQMSFVTGPRGIEGPMSNLIFGGGTSVLGV